MPQPSDWYKTRGATVLAVAALLLVAAYVRLAHGDLSFFSYDQARDAYVATGIVSGRSFPLLGPAVEGGPGHTWGPAYFYLLAVPFAFSRDPSLAVTFLSALGLASMFLTYRLGRAFFGTPAGIVAAALFATYPLLVIGSKAISNVAALPFFTLIFFHALFSLVVNGQSFMIIPIMVALALLVQLHLSSLSFLLVLVLAFALFRPRVRAAHVAIGLTVFLLLMLPYLTAQALSNFQDVRALFSYTTSQFRPRYPWELYQLAARILFASPDVTASFEGIEQTWRSGVFLGLHRLEAWLLVVGIAYLGVTLIRQWIGRTAPGASTASYGLLTLWLVIPFLTISLRGGPYVHHFDALYPAPFLAAGVLVSDLLKGGAAASPAPARVLLRTAVYALLALIVVSQVDFHMRLWRAITTAGAILWAPAAAPVVEIMPIRYKSRLVRTLVQDYGADRQGFFHRVHGSRFHDLLEDDGYFFEWITESTSGGTANFSSSSFHYAIIRDEHSGEPIRGRRLTTVGPYTIVEYAPLVDYTTWTYAYDAERWLTLSLPTARVPDPTTSGGTRNRVWQALPLYCRGKIWVDHPPPSRIRLIVSIRTLAQGGHAIPAFYLNGKAVTTHRAVSHSTLLAHDRDMIFDLSEGIQEGWNDVAFQISEGNLEFDLDVYEIRR